MQMWWAFIATGIAAGVASGLFGIGGGIVIIPILVFALDMNQQAASATSLVALLLPVGIFAVWNYWSNGVITTYHIHAGLLLALGITVGAFLGSKIAIGLSPVILRRAFAGFLVLVAGRLAFM